jgi:hypothetical protein
VTQSNLAILTNQILSAVITSDWAGGFYSYRTANQLLQLQ